jgi:hypothetical protein
LVANTSFGKEVIGINRKILIVILVLSLASIIPVAAFAPAFARYKKPDNSIVVSTGQHGEVVLQLPPGVPSHPTCLRIVAETHDKKAAFGPYDSMSVMLWIPESNGFQVVGLLSNNPNPELYTFLKNTFNNTFIWNPVMPNIFNVTRQDLNVWTEGDTIIANLTKSVKITLPFNLVPSPSISTWGNLTFILPPMTLTFRPTAHGFHFEETTVLAPSPPLSGYTLKINSWQSPAWVTAEIPAWSRSFAWEFSGHICTHLTSTYIPPTT